MVAVLPLRLARRLPFSFVGFLPRSKVVDCWSGSTLAFFSSLDHLVVEEAGYFQLTVEVEVEGQREVEEALAVLEEEVEAIHVVLKEPAEVKLAKKAYRR